MGLLFALFKCKIHMKKETVADPPSVSTQCIEEWLWRKHFCPTCHVQVSMPQPVYWSSTRVKVP